MRDQRGDVNQLPRPQFMGARSAYDPAEAASDQQDLTEIMAQGRGGEKIARSGGIKTETLKSLAEGSVLRVFTQGKNLPEAFGYYSINMASPKEKKR